MASPDAKAALERRLRGASARVTPRDDDDDTINNDAQATPRPLCSRKRGGPKEKMRRRRCLCSHNALRPNPGGVPRSSRSVIYCENPGAPKKH